MIMSYYRNQETSWLEIVKYACWSDRKKILHIVNVTIIVIACIAFCAGIGIFVQQMSTGRSFSNMDGRDYGLSFSFAVLIGAPILLLVCLILSCIIGSIKWCRDYYARKKEELKEVRAKRDPGLMA